MIKLKYIYLILIILLLNIYFVSSKEEINLDLTQDLQSSEKFALEVVYNVSGTGHNESTYYMNTRPADFIQVVNTNGTIINETYIYLQDKLIAKIDTNNRKFFYHPDHLGSTSLVTNESGNQKINFKTTIYL